jgi:heterodisulfide reductase subunit A-like polyferredoxin
MVYVLDLAISIFFTGHYFEYTSNTSLTSRAMKNIVILGGSYAGISAAHAILKQATKAGPLKITLVSPNTHAYGNMAAARGLVPGEFTDDTLFRPILPGFTQYSSSQFEFILASAKNLDVKAKTVRISSATGSSSLQYDYLVLATGSRTKETTPLKGLGSTEETKAALHEYQGQVEKAKRIVVAGAGVTGTETAGELAYKYGLSKEMILVSISTNYAGLLPPFLNGRIPTNIYAAFKHPQNPPPQSRFHLQVRNNTSPQAPRNH